MSPNFHSQLSRSLVSPAQLTHRAVSPEHRLEAACAPSGRSSPRIVWRSFSTTDIPSTVLSNLILGPYCGTGYGWCRASALWSTADDRASGSVYAGMSLNGRVPSDVNCLFRCSSLDDGGRQDATRSSLPAQKQSQRPLVLRCGRSIHNDCGSKSIFLNSIFAFFISTFSSARMSVISCFPYCQRNLSIS